MIEVMAELAAQGGAPLRGLMASGATRRPVRIGLVNNMPDAAFEDTEAQFRQLLDAAGGEGAVELHRFWLPGLERGPRVQAILEARYLSWEEVRGADLDGLIVTGTEPTAARLQDEPYWEVMTAVLDWGLRNCGAVVASCLAAHGVALMLDGLERVRLDSKCFGLSPASVVEPAPLTRGLGESLEVPHSHSNTVALDALVRRGYRPLLSDSGDWSVVSRQEGGCLLVMVQGHPEYDRLALLKEYRRDWRRFHLGQARSLPTVPRRYLGGAAAPILSRLSDQVAGGPDRTTSHSFPAVALATMVEHNWSRGAQLLYRNWLEYLVAPKTAAETSGLGRGG